MNIELSAVDHIYVAVSNLERSITFYDPVMKCLGLRLGIEPSPPKLYPEHGSDYYATCFTDPDGIRLELVAMRRFRALIRDHWRELTEFEDPLTKAGLLP